jgi:hypothetical protein
MNHWPLKFNDQIQEILEGECIQHCTQISNDPTYKSLCLHYRTDFDSVLDQRKFKDRIDRSVSVCKHLLAICKNTHSSQM